MLFTTKPLLIIGCSDAKLDVEAEAFDLYQGGIFKMLRANLENPLDHFDILIVSAEHGLISARDMIAPYNTRMCSRTKPNEIAAFATLHGTKALKTIRSYADKETDVFVALSNDYLAAFEAILEGKKESVLSGFKSHYISEGHRGIGDLRGRLKRVINTVKGQKEFTPTLFRSGVANFSELGYLAAGCDIGTSLAHVNTKKSTDLLSVILDSAKRAKIFIDNGIITCVNQGKEVNPDWIFDQYEQIISSLKPAVAKNISIVVPDDVACNENAVAIVKKYKKVIKKLANRCDVILPIHKSEDIRSHALNMMSELNFHSNIRLGVPCLTKAGLNFALEVSDIDAILSLKHPTKGTPLFSKVHYFGLSDVTAAKKLAPRLKIAELHGVDTMLDCCRTAALFGKTKKGLRKGSEKAEAIKSEHMETQVKESDAYKAHSFREENHKADSSPIVTQDLHDLINEDDIFKFIDIYNEIMSDTFNFQMPSFEIGEEEEAVQMAWDIVSQRAVAQIIFEKLKVVNWDNFQLIINECTPMTPHDVRFNAIKDLFIKEDNEVTPLQMPLRLAA